MVWFCQKQLHSTKVTDATDAKKNISMCFKPGILRLRPGDGSASIC